MVQQQIINNALRVCFAYHQQIPDNVLAQLNLAPDTIERITFDLNRSVGKKKDERIYSFIRYDIFLHPYAKALKLSVLILALFFAWSVF